MLGGGGVAECCDITNFNQITTRMRGSRTNDNGTLLPGRLSDESSASKGVSQDYSSWPLLIMRYDVAFVCSQEEEHLI